MDKIWDIDERTFQFAVRVVKMTRYLPSKEMATWIIGKQVIRSAASINSNIVHAKSSASTKDFCHYLRISLREAKETKRWLEMIIATELSEQSRMNSLLQENDEIISILVVSVKKASDNS